MPVRSFFIIRTCSFLQVGISWFLCLILQALLFDLPDWWDGRGLRSQTKSRSKGKPSESHCTGSRIHHHLHVWWYSVCSIHLDSSQSLCGAFTWVPIHLRYISGKFSICLTPVLEQEACRLLLAGWDCSALLRQLFASGFAASWLGLRESSGGYYDSYYPISFRRCDCLCSVRLSVA